MFDIGDGPAKGCQPATRATAPAAPQDPHGTVGLGAGAVRAWIAGLGGEASGLDDTARIDLIRALEDLKSAASAAQARVSVDFDVSQRAAQRRAGVPAERLGVGVGAQIALARRESPHAGGRCLGLARALVDEMPCTLAALSSGALSEWRATLLARESACLTREDRARFDGLVVGDVGVLVGLGTRALVARAKAVAQRLDVAAVVARARRAESERCVTLRPAPDTMTYLTALLPVAQGVAAYAALRRAADTARAAGDPRNRGQAMADEIVARIATGTGTDAEAGTGTPAGGGDATAHWAPNRLEVQLVMTDRTLLAGADEPARIPGYGTVPGPWARNLVLNALDTRPRSAPSARSDGDPRSDSCAPADGGQGSDEGTWPRGLGPTAVWVRRLFTHPTSGRLVAMDSRGRLAPEGLADLIRARDGGACRTPYCGALIRHIDHVTPAADGGPTSAANLQGICERCNYTKEAPGWRASAAPPGNGGSRCAPDEVRPDRVTPDEVMSDDVAPDVVLTTPTRHRYLSRAPALPGSDGPDAGAVEHRRAPARRRRRRRRRPIQEGAAA